MIKHLFSLLLCVILLAALPLSASAEVLDEPLMPEENSLAGALYARDRDKVLKLLEEGVDGYGVVVDLESFNALVFAPADPQMYYQMPDMENRVLISRFIAPEAPDATPVGKTKPAFYYDPAEYKYARDYVCMAADLRALSLPERVLTEFDPILDSALFVRESGFYDVSNLSCSGCGAYLPELVIGKHCVLACGVHMGCFYDPNDITHYTVCVECGRMKCACYCNNYVGGAPLLAAIGGSDSFAVGGVFHEEVTLAFEEGAKVTYFGEMKAREALTAPKASCVVCKKALSLPRAESFECAAHYACADCRAKLMPDALTAHTQELECGHYACDGRKHSTEIYSPNCPNFVKHHKCEGYPHTHFCDECKQQFSCEDGLMHAYCLICSQPWCNGKEHGPTLCG